MLRSLHVKPVMLMVLLILSLMTVVGAFLINSVVAFYVQDSYSQRSTEFGDQEIVSGLTHRCGWGDRRRAGALIRSCAECLCRPRWAWTPATATIYILDGGGGPQCRPPPTARAAPDPGRGPTPGTCSSANESGREGDRERLRPPTTWTWPSPSTRGGSDYIIYILDQRGHRVREPEQPALPAHHRGPGRSAWSSRCCCPSSSRRAMVTPIERLTEGAERVADGDFSHKIEVASRDEIGVLTGTFNDMAQSAQAHPAARWRTSATSWTPSSST